MNQICDLVFYIFVGLIYFCFIRLVYTDKIMTEFDKGGHIIRIRKNQLEDIHKEGSLICLQHCKKYKPENESICHEEFTDLILFNKSGCIYSIFKYNCATYNEVKDIVEIGKCIFNYKYSGKYSSDKLERYTTLPSSVIVWNEVFCGKFNRRGTLCGSCQNGTYPLAYSFNLSCVKCNNNQSNWWKYVFFSFIPLSLFYFIVLFFKISIFSSSLQGYILCCQLISMPAVARIILIVNKDSPYSYRLLQLLESLYGIWNLDFFRSYDLGICLKISTLATLSLDLAVSVYPLLLIAITYFLIQLYDANFRIIIILWKPFKSLHYFFYKNRNIRITIVDTFATFLLLSNVKFLSVCCDILIPVKVIQLNAQKNMLNYSWRMYNDASIVYFSSQHLPYAIIAIIVSITYIVLPTLFLLLYSFSACQFILNKLSPGSQLVIRTFVDIFQGCYKDGTQPKGSDYRWLSAMPFIIRLVIFFVYAMTLNSSFDAYAAMILVLNVIIIIQFDPYKDSSLNKNISLFMLLVSYILVCFLGHDHFNKVINSIFTPMVITGGSVPLFFVFKLIINFLFNKRRFGLS